MTSRSSQTLISFIPTSVRNSKRGREEKRLCTLWTIWSQRIVAKLTHKKSDMEKESFGKLLFDSISECFSPPDWVRPASDLNFVVLKVNSVELKERLLIGCQLYLFAGEVSTRARTVMVYGELARVLGSTVMMNEIIIIEGAYVSPYRNVIVLNNPILSSPVNVIHLIDNGSNAPYLDPEHLPYEKHFAFPYESVNVYNYVSQSGNSLTRPAFTVVKTVQICELTESHNYSNTISDSIKKTTVEVKLKRTKRKGPPTIIPDTPPVGFLQYSLSKQSCHYATLSQIDNPLKNVLCEEFNMTGTTVIQKECICFATVDEILSNSDELSYRVRISDQTKGGVLLRIHTSSPREGRCAYHRMVEVDDIIRLRSMMVQREWDEIDNCMALTTSDNYILISPDSQPNSHEMSEKTSVSHLSLPDSQRVEELRQFVKLRREVSAAISSLESRQNETAEVGSMDSSPIDENGTSYRIKKLRS